MFNNRADRKIDVLSLLLGLAFAVLGGVGLLQAAGVVDNGAAWAAIVLVAAVGTAGAALSIHAARAVHAVHAAPVAGSDPETEPDPDTDTW